MYKIIACDLDETLLMKKDRTINPIDLEAIRKAKELGVKFVPATGRGFNSVQGTLKELGLYDLENEYVISYNGGAITENKDNRLIHFQGISFEVASELYRRGLQYDVCVHVYTKDTVYAYAIFPSEAAYVKGRQEMVEIEHKDLEFLRGQEIVKVLYANENMDYLHSIADELKDITDDLDVSYSSNRYLEFNCKGVNKGAGLRSLANLLGVDIKDTIAIGDNYNDLPMIKEAGLGVGVANTIESMKPECDLITENDCDHGAVKEVIERFILNGEK